MIYLYVVSVVTGFREVRPGPHVVQQWRDLNIANTTSLGQCSAGRDVHVAFRPAVPER